MEDKYRYAFNVLQLSRNADVSYGKVNQAFKFNSSDYLRKSEKEDLIEASAKAHEELKTFLS